MARAGQALTSPTGETLLFLQTAADTKGSLLEVEATYLPGREAPPEHYHPFQTEHFEVLSGTMRACIGGVTATYKAGDSFEVPSGVIHTMCNGGDDVARMRWQVRPALKTEDFFEAVWGLAHEDKTGKLPLLQLAVIVRAYDREFRLARPAYPIQKIGMGVLASVGKLLGYRSRYP